MKIVIPTAGNDSIHVHVDPIEQQGSINLTTSSKQILQATPQDSSGSLVREEEEESENEDISQGQTDFVRRAGRIMSLEAPAMPPSHPTVTTSQQLFRLPHLCFTPPLGLPAPAPAPAPALPLVTDHSPPGQTVARIPLEKAGVFQQEGHSEGGQVLDSMASRNRTEAMSTDEPQGALDHVGNEDTNAAGLREAIDERGNQRMDDQATATSVIGLPGVHGNEDQNGATSRDMNTNESGPVGREKAPENERDRITHNMDVDQPNSGDEGCTAGKRKEKGKGSSVRRSDRKRKTPPLPERHGASRSNPKPTSRKKAKSREQPPKPAPMPEPRMKLTVRPDFGRIERNYFEEIEIGGTSKLIDMIDLTQDMVGHRLT